MLLDPVRSFAKRHACGHLRRMILMAKEIGRDQAVLVDGHFRRRNAFVGRSTVLKNLLKVDVLREGPGRPFPGIFIRAPRLVEPRPPAHIIAA